MRNLNVLIVLLAVFMCSNAVIADEIGDPNHPGRLEFIYPDHKLMAKIDGMDLEPTEGMKATIELSHGKHLLQIFKMKGMFKAETIIEENVHVAGGHITRVTIKNNTLDVIETAPIPGMIPETTKPPESTKAEPAGSATTTTTTTTMTAESTENVSTSLGAGNANVNIAVNMPGMSTKTTVTEQTTTTMKTTESTAPPTTEPIKVDTRYSKVIFMSSEGMADIYIDGKKKLELPMSGIDEMAKATWFDVKPGVYLIKIEGFDVWYDGKLKVGPGEEIKINVEQNLFDIISRETMP